MVVASLIDGRVRVRDEGLKKEQLAERVKEELMADPGVSSVEVNPRVGSLLIIYRAAVTAVEKILHLLSELLGSGPEPGKSEEEAHHREGRRSWEPSHPGKVPFGKVSLGSLRFGRMPFSISRGLRRTLVNFGMLASLVISVGLAFLDLKKLHILTGVVFMLLFGDHFYQRRGHMFA